jgi:DNA polymerase
LRRSAARPSAAGRAAYSLLGHATPIGPNRGRLLDSELFGAPVLVTTHPSSVLREREREARQEALRALAADLSRASA